MEVLTKEICTEIAEICKIDINIVLENKNQSFFDEPFYFTSELLLYLYFHIKEKYKIEFSSKDLVNYAFLNIESLTNLIQRNIEL